MSKNLKNGLLAGVAAGTLAAGASMSESATQAVAEWIAGETPEMPERKEAKRGPVNVAIGIDASASKIRKKVGTAMTATSDFIENGGLLADGDRVKFCEVGGAKGGEGEPVRCADYTLPGGQAELLTDIRDTQSTFWSTHVLRALEQMNQEAPCATAVWTDAITEEKDDGYPVPMVQLGTCELKILIPDTEYRQRALDLCTRVEPQQQCEVVEATTGADVTTALSGVVEAVQKEAQEKADSLAEAEYQEAMEDYERERAELKAQAEAYKSTARKIVGGLFTALMAGIGAYAAYVNRPIVKGFVYTLKKSGQLGETDLEALYGAGKIELHKLNTRLPASTFKARWFKGTEFNGQPIPRTHEPTELASGVVYSATRIGKKDPRRDEILAILTDQNRSEE